MSSGLHDEGFEIMKGVKEKKPGSTVKKQGIFVFCLCIAIMFFLIIFLMVRFGRDTDQIFDKVIEDMLVPSHTETVRVVNDKLKEHEGEIEEEKIFNGNTAKKENRVYHYICTREGKVLAGDVKYGSRYRGCALALWSHSLGFRHPATGKAMSFAAMPEAVFPWNGFEYFK